MSTRPTIELGPEGNRYRLYDPGGGGRVAKILRTGTPYESDVVEDMASLEATGFAVDAGANIGNHTLWLAVVCGLYVHAFEPIKYEKLRANVALNTGTEERVTVHAWALGRDDGMAEIVGHNRLAPGEGKVGVRTLDGYGFQGVSILKIDVEGMEADVIAGGLDTIARERPVIYSEAWDDDYLHNQARLLEPLGYRYGHKFRWHQHRWDP